MISNQAQRVMKKFGGPRRLQQALAAVGRELSLTTVYRWKMPREKGGTGGMIPSCNLPFLIKAGRLQGIIISEKDLFVAGDNAIARGLDRPDYSEEDDIAKKPRKPRKTPPYFTLRRLAKIGADLAELGLTPNDVQRGAQ